MFSIKVQIFIRTSVTVLIEHGQGRLISKLEGFEKWIFSTFHNLLLGKVDLF